MGRKSFIRRVEVQIGIILGVVMFSVLGVFLGIRKGERKQEEAAVVTKLVDEAPGVRLQEQAQAPEGQVQPKEWPVAQAGVAPSAQETAVPGSGIPGEVALAPQVPTAEMPIPGEPALGEQVTAETPSATVQKEASLPTPAPITLPTTHVVKPNENLTTLARRYYGDDAKWILIYEANRLANQNALVVGQKLSIPKPGEVKVNKQQIVKVSSAKSRKASPGRAHRVQRGDTLFELARTYYGDESKWERIYEANQDLFTKRDELEPGDVLIIP
jgi:nucleoid-associated protein YgaU